MPPESKALVIRRALVKALEALLMAAMTVLVLDVLWGVASRYLLGEQSSWTEELARMILIWVVLLGGAAAFGSREHLGVDYFVGRMDPASKKRLRIVVDLTALAFTIGVLLIGGIRLVSETFRLQQTLMALGVSKGYVYLAVPVSGFFFLYFSAESLVKTLLGRDDGRLEGEGPCGDPGEDAGQVPAGSPAEGQP